MKNQKLSFLFVLALAITGCNVVNTTISGSSSFNNGSSTESSSSASSSSICEHDFVYAGDENEAPTIIQSQGAKYVCSKCGQEKYSSSL